MSKYSEREKRGHFNKLRGHASHVDADLKLLEKLSPNNELLSSPRVSNLGDKLLMALLDLTTSCDIVAFRREYSKSEQMETLSDEDYEYEKGVLEVRVGQFFRKFGMNTVISTSEDIDNLVKYVAGDSILKVIGEADILLGTTGCDLVFVEKLKGVFQFEKSEQKQREDSYKTKLDVYIQKVGADFVFSSVEDVAIMFQMLGLPMPDPQKEGELALSDLIGIPFSELSFSNPSILKSEDADVINRYKSKKKEVVKNDVKKENLKEQKQELEDKEFELADKEQVLEEKESELKDKEQKLSEKSEENKKKAVPKKKSTKK